VIEDLGGGKVGIGKPGILLGNEIAELVNAGYQMFLRTPSGREAPALAPHLKTLHAFDEDLREGLGLTSHFFRLHELLNGKALQLLAGVAQ
jgi:hypothetical protein